MVGKLEKLLFALLLLLGLFMRLHTVNWDSLVYPDSTRYLSLAREMSTGGEQSSFHSALRSA